MVEALEILYQTGQLHLSTELLNKLAARGFTDIVSKASKGMTHHHQHTIVTFRKIVTKSKL